MIPDNSALSMRTRWITAGLLSCSLAINLVDRQVLNVLAPVLRQNMHWTNSEFSYTAVAFEIGMLSSQVPSGALMDAAGTKTGLAIIFVLWSVVGGAHALAASLAAFMALRFLMGTAECGNYAAGIKSIAGLFPARIRSSAGGVFNAGAQLGSMLAPPLVVFVAARFGYRAAFFGIAAVGLLWLIPWLMAVPDAGRPTSDNARAAPKIGFAHLVRNRSVVGLFFVRVFTGPLTTFYWVWLPSYMKADRHMTMAMIGLFLWVPHLAGAAGNVLGGIVADRLIRIFGSVDRARKAAFTCAFLLEALSVFVPFASGFAGALGIISCVLFGNQWVAATYIAAVGDIFPARVAGRVNGLAGLGDSGAVLVTVLATGAIVDRYSFTPVFIAAGAFPLLALASVFFVLRRIEPADL